MATTPSSRRQRLRAQTEAEIKELARSALTASGTFSLREIARRMSMAPSSLYNYFAGRDDLLAVLTADAHRSLTDALTAAAGGPEPFLAVGHAYRRWAIEHRTEWALVRARVGADGPLLRVVAGALAAHGLDVARIDAGLDPGLRADLQRSDRTGLPPAALAGTLWCLAALHGATALEPVRDNPALFESTLRAVLRTCQASGSGRTS